MTWGWGLAAFTMVLAPTWLRAADPTTAATALSGTSSSKILSGTTGLFAPSGTATSTPNARYDPAPISGTARSGAQAVGKLRPFDRSLWSKSGFEYRFSLGVLKPWNGQALSYMPIEAGWRFADGWRVLFGLEAYYYQGLSTDAADPIPTLFSYQMEDFRLSALYEWPWNYPIRPLAGVTFESVFGSRWLSNNPNSLANSTVENAQGFEAPGFEAGLEYRGGPNWALNLEARYVRGPGSKAAMAGTDLGCSYLY